MSEKRVMLVEDDELLRASLAMFLSRYGCEVTEAEDEAYALECLRGGGYDLVISDLSLAGGSGFGIMKYLQDNTPNTRCIVITGHTEVDSAIRALRKGAFDYLLKPFRYDGLKAAVEKAFRKQADERLIRRVSFPMVAKRYGLTPRETDITRVVLNEGLGNDELAERFNISKNTVKVHLRNIFRKVGVDSKASLASTVLSD